MRPSFRRSRALAPRSFTRVALLLPVVALAACGDVLGSGDPDPARYQIVFVTDSDPSPGVAAADIFRMNADGTGLVNLTRQPAQYEGLDVSPDGRRIVFSSNRGSAWPPQIWVMDTDGSHLRQLTTGGTGGYQPHWSPDGNWIAFLGNGVQVMDASGGDLHTVSNGVAQTGCGASSVVRLGVLGWTPDGRVAFSHHECGVGTHYYAVQPFGFGLQALGHDFRHAYSPDGSRIALVRDWNGFDRLSVMNADGSGLRALTSHAGQDRLEARWGSEYSPWSPDGRRILFMRVGVAEESGFHVIDADGSGLRRVGGGGVFSGWSPAGDRFVFLAVENGDFDVFVARADGTGPVNLTRSPARDTEPHWVPRR